MAAYPSLIRVMRARWPEALKAAKLRKWNEQQSRGQTAKLRREREEAEQDRAAHRRREEEWDRLAADQRAAVEREVETARPGCHRIKATFKKLCVQEYARRQGGGGVVGEIAGHFSLPGK